MIIPILTPLLLNGLILFYKILGENLGVAIIVFSLVLVFLMKPLTKPYMQSMKKIRELEPQLAKLRKKFGKDKMKMSQAQAELYKQNKINPMAGCLPYILQFVILIALFGVFTTTFPKNVNVAAITADLNKRLYTPLQFSQGQILNTKFLYLDISQPDKLNRLIPGIPDFIPGIFVILATLGQFLSVKIMAPYLSEEEKIAKKTKSEADDIQVAMQSSMTYTLPLMTLYFGLQFQSGLAIYWLVFSIVNVWQQVSMSGWGSLTPTVNLVKSKLTIKK
ncbi:MAG: YidC/Oxa1 family membrane protein insertase [Candidatus Microgenomates bacterium]|jgi:YidC/Oxa1 family membrane protein insertase